jgi:hypothetical protein
LGATCTAIRATSRYSRGRAKSPSAFAPTAHAGNADFGTHEGGIATARAAFDATRAHTAHGGNADFGTDESGIAATVAAFDAA